MFVIDHTVGGTEECPEISFHIVGSTGNIYKVVIRKEPTCDCPDGAKGNQCKHICYGESLTNLRAHFYMAIRLLLSIMFLLIVHQVLLHALNAAAHLRYQLAFLSSVSVMIILVVGDQQS
jgi:hypothetical protein